MRFFGTPRTFRKVWKADVVAGPLAVVDATVMEEDPPQPKKDIEPNAQQHLHEMIEHWNSELKLNMKKDFALVPVHVASTCDHASNLHKCLACQERSALQVQRNDIKEFLRIFLKQ